MPRYYGVECELCGTVIALGRHDKDEGKNITFYTTPLEPIPCPECGGSYLYEPGDLFGFGLEESIAQFPAKTKASKPKK